ncbi:unnamed protein product, partial [Plutella xylostella]
MAWKNEIRIPYPTSRYLRITATQYIYRIPTCNRRAVAHQAKPPSLVGGSSLFNGGVATPSLLH